MNLGEIFAGIPLPEAIAPALAAVEVGGLDYDSRRVDAGFLFFAFPGARTDGRRFVREAVARGAVAIASEFEPREESLARLRDQARAP